MKPAAAREVSAIIPENRLLSRYDRKFVNHAADAWLKADQNLGQLLGVLAGNRPGQQRCALGGDLDCHTRQRRITTPKSREPAPHLAREQLGVVAGVLKRNLLPGANHASFRLTLAAGASLIAAASLIRPPATAVSKLPVAKLPLAGRGTRLLADALIANKAACIVVSSYESAAGRCPKLGSTLRAAERLVAGPAQYASLRSAAADNGPGQVTADLPSGALRTKLAGRLPQSTDRAAATQGNRNSKCKHPIDLSHDASLSLWSGSLMHFSQSRQFRQSHGSNYRLLPQLAEAGSGGPLDDLEQLVDLWVNLPVAAV